MVKCRMAFQRVLTFVLISLTGYVKPQGCLSVQLGLLSFIKEREILPFLMCGTFIQYLRVMLGPRGYFNRNE